MAKVAWLDGQPVQALTALVGQRALPDAWRAGELVLWLRRCGQTGPIPPDVPALLAFECAGQARAGPDAWQALGCPYDQPLALLEGDADDLRQALALLEVLGAKAAARLARRRLRALGERKVSRGPYGHAQHDPLGLTSREREVLELIGKGQSNREIAATLHRSERKVETHVAALLTQLDVRGRHQAALRLRQI